MFCFAGINFKVFIFKFVWGELLQIWQCQVDWLGRGQDPKENGKSFAGLVVQTGS